MSRTIIATLASTIQARLNCEQRPANAQWFQRHSDRIDNICSELLPSGSGIDQGVKVDLVRSTGEKVVLLVPFHCMDPNGFYDGWRDFVVTITPSFDGHNIKVSGRDYHGLKEYLADLFSETLGRPFPDGMWASKE